MSTFDELVDDVQRTLYGYGLAQPRAGFLVNAITDSDTNIQVRPADGFEQGVADIGNETIFIESVDYGSGILTVSPDGRGFYSTAAEAHAANSRVTMSPTWSRAQIARAINDAILGTFPTLFGVAQTSFNYVPTQTTYPLPAEAIGILRVTTDTIGPSDEQLAINRYSFNTNAPTGKFTEGNSITLEKGGIVGRPVTVTYSKEPTELSFGDDFTDCGLEEPARIPVKLAACSQLLAFMDSSRLPVNTAQADQYDPTQHPLGSASKLSAQLYQRYLLELENERKRLRSKTRFAISVRTR